MTLIREPSQLSPPLISTEIYSCHYILLRHPGYDDSNNVLLRLLASDIAPDSRVRGLYAGYALDACGIIAGNRWEGWLSEAKEHNASARIDPTSILQKSSYYFHLPPQQGELDASHPEIPYPIVPTFYKWRFPHDHLPYLWRQMASAECSSAAPKKSFAASNLSAALQARDVSCRITDCSEVTQVAHICPQKEFHWWTENGMARYNVSLTPTLDDTSNALLLRADLHFLLDNAKFVFVPKPSFESGNPRLVTHLIEASAELEHLYHNRALHPVGSRVENIFARFAFSVFPQLTPFLTYQRRRLLLSNEDANFLDDDGFVPWDRCAEFFKKPPRSPKKRKPGAETGTDPNKGFSVGADGECRPAKRHQFKRLISRHRFLGQDDESISSDTSDQTSGSEDALPLSTHPDREFCRGSDSSTPASSKSVTTLAVQSPSSPLGSDDSEHDHQLRPSGSFTCTDPSLDSSTLANEWLARERLRSDTHNKWDEEKSWAKEVWKGKILLNGEKARKFFEICGVEVLESGDSVLDSGESVLVSGE